MDQQSASELIKRQASALGFFACGIAQSGFLEDHQPRLRNWIDKGSHGEMEWMARNMDKRLDPGQLVDNARSVIVVLQNYFPSQSLPPDADYLISRYAYGEDYHFVIKRKLRKLADFMQNNIASHNWRCFTDSAPVLERAWAVKAGLGWIGKNSMLITPRNGSYFFIGELITDLELDYDKPSGGDYCGDCNRCIEACPTNAIGSDRSIDARRCISYLTIEKKGDLPEVFSGAYKQWVFGCDICQEVCPWNRFSKPHNEPSFNLPADIGKMNRDDWETLSQDDFKEKFRKSPLKRAKYEGIKRNIAFLK